MPHLLEQYTENLGNVVDNEQSVPITERVPKEVIRINIFRGGHQTSQSGMSHVFTEDDLQQVVDTYAPDVHVAPLIRGHEEKDDGAPSSGWVQRVIRNGLDLFAEVALTGFGQQMLEEGNYKRVSCRFYPPEDQSNPYPDNLSLRHLALVTVPAVKGLQEFSEGVQIGSGNEWEFIFSENLAPQFSDTEEKKEVRDKIVGKMQEFMLDGEEPKEDKGENVEKMELSEEEEALLAIEISPAELPEETPGVGVPFEPLLVGQTDGCCEPSMEGNMDFNLDGNEEVEYSDSATDIKKNADDEEGEGSSTHDSGSERQKEYKKILKDSYVDDNKSISGASKEEQSSALMGNLMKHYGNNRAAEKTPERQIETESSLNQEKNKAKEVAIKDFEEYMLLDGLIFGESVDMDKEELSEADKDEKRLKKQYGIKDDTSSPKKKAAKKEDKEEKTEKVKVKNVELLIPEPKKGKKASRLSDQSYSESISAQLSEIEQFKTKQAWKDFSEAYYSGGVLTESIIPQEDLIESLMFLDNQTSSLSFSENQVNPLDTITKLLNSLPQVVGLNGYDPKPSSSSKMFREPLVENSDSLVYSEGGKDVAYDAGSYGLHQQALTYSEENNVDYYEAVQRIVRNTNS